MPGKAKTGIRFRVDGSLQPCIEVPAQFRQAMVTRLKIMWDLDISEKRKLQDGKIKFKKYGPLDIELRVSTIPSAGGVEDVIMRILAAGEPIPLEKLGLTAHNKERLEKTVSKPYGLFYVCGPTGSGKTTTLHSILKFLNTPDTKIWTAEDPVEITQKGGCARSRSTKRPALTLHWSCGLFCALTQTSSWSASRATKRRFRWALRRR
jgi:type II secretory ATPase GspE/PulE/Tfp pilus assembly ATPase PilB-like protein